MKSCELKQRSSVRSSRESMFCRSLSWMRGGTAGTGKSSELSPPVCDALRWLPACGVNCGDSVAAAVAAVVGRCPASTAVPLRVPGVDWMRDGLTRKIRDPNAFIHHSILIFMLNTTTTTTTIVQNEVCIFWSKCFCEWYELLVLLRLPSFRLWSVSAKTKTVFNWNSLPEEHQKQIKNCSMFSSKHQFSKNITGNAD